MKKIGSYWQAEISGIENFDTYKYAIVGCDGRIVLKSDPYARHFETAPSNASKIYYEDFYNWNDGEWENRRNTVNIYEPK